MPASLATGSIVASGGEAIPLSSLFSVTPGIGNPQFLILSGLDRDEYTVSSTGSTGTVTGNGVTAGFANIGGDSLGLGIVFTYNPLTGKYKNAVYGNINRAILTASQDTDANEAISLFSTNNAFVAATYADNPYSLAQMTTYVGTVSVVTQPAFVGPAPSQATPDSISSTALSFVGEAWNTNGCWTLTSNIAAMAGASLPLSSTSLGIPGTVNGEWIVAYNGPAGQGGNWQAVIKTGEMVAFETSATTGHITTVVSGSGTSAMLVDNITYVNSNGSFANSAHDGSADDVIIAAPHAASQEFSTAVAGSVVYELDTPTITVATASSSAVVNTRLPLLGLFSTSDPAGRTITAYQLYDTGAADAAQLMIRIDGGVKQAAHSAATAITEAATSLATTILKPQAITGVDTLEIRAFNGSYWGDWQALTVNLITAAQASQISAAAPGGVSSQPVASAATQLAEAIAAPAASAATTFVALTPTTAHLLAAPAA
ncbi:hypothetical protein [Beijerinckia sp. L45]|uniref:hypothetical protein n=1 Tax=Beijerinckia sp. L45 TaxID=1641855 RepID=UPI00131AFD20|nr:hypothetical protein [Beijerinckia sp. L45]